MKKLFLLVALFAFIGTSVTTTATVVDENSKIEVVKADNDKDLDKDKDKKKKKDKKKAKTDCATKCATSDKKCDTATKKACCPSTKSNCGSKATPEKK